MTVRATAVMMAVLTGWPVAASSFLPTLDQRAIEEAIALGRSRIGVERGRFHEAYRVVVSQAPLDFVDVVTPFRRAVLAAEAAARRGDRSFGQRDVLELLAAKPGQVDLYFELTFHPLNTYLGVPAFDVSLASGGGGPRIEPRTVERLPRYTPRVEGEALPLAGGLTASAPRGSGPLLGATVIAAFDVRLVDPDSRYTAVLSEAGEERARAVIDLGAVR